MRVVPKAFRYLDPLALFLGKNLEVYDNHKIKALPRHEKRISIPYVTQEGKTSPSGTKFVWPFRC